MNNIKAAKETIKITECGSYEVSGKKVVFSKEELNCVTVYSPEESESI